QRDDRAFGFEIAPLNARAGYDNGVLGRGLRGRSSRRRPGLGLILSLGPRGHEQDDGARRGKRSTDSGLWREHGISPRLTSPPLTAAVQRAKDGPGRVR